MLVGTLVGTAALLAARGAPARGRAVAGGRVALRVPWPVATIDPHRIEDAAAAIFGEALFDTLYAVENGVLVPALAEGDPEVDGAFVRVKLRAGLRTGRERPFGTRDAIAAIARSRAMGGRGWLADVPVPRDDGGKALLFATKDAGKLARLLASPIVAMVPNGFTPEAPDGTGPFRFATRDGAMILSRSSLAARGPSFLDEVVVRPAADVSASLLAFEAGSDDIGWFERGLHEPRPGSKSFDHGVVGWAALFTGRDANDWDGPGIAQRICDGIPYARLSSLHLGAAWSPEPEQGWGGPPVSILVREDAPWLVAVANALAAALTRPSHEVTVKTAPAAEVAARRASRMFGLVLDVVRSIAPGGLGATISLATADNPTRAQEIMQHPPKLGDVPARTLTRTLRVGIVGEVRVSGGRTPELSLAPSQTGASFDLGASSHTRR